MMNYKSLVNLFLRTKQTKSSVKRNKSCIMKIHSFIYLFILFFHNFLRNTKRERVTARDLLFFYYVCSCYKLILNLVPCFCASRSVRELVQFAFLKPWQRVRHHNSATVWCMSRIFHF